MLEIDSVELSFRGRQVLSGCYLRSQPGEVLGLLGRNGCGKSSLLKIIFGSLKADFKFLRLNGEIIHRGYTTGQIAYLPQQHFMLSFLKLSVVYEAFSGPIKKHLLTSGLLNDGNELCLNDLSYGHRRFIECLWILSRPVEYILLDEPFSGVAPIQVEFLQKLIIEIGKEKAIVLTDHIYRPLIEVSSRVILLHNNSVYNIAHAEDLITHNYLPA